MTSISHLPNRSHFPLWRRAVFTIFLTAAVPTWRPQLTLGATVGDQPWSQFQGPRANDTCLEADIPLKWSESENVRWKTPIHDRGHSSPVVWGNQIWMTTATPDGKQLYVVCVALDSGKILFDKLIFEVDKPQFSHSLNSYASPTPIVEEGRVYVNFGAYGTACLDTATGKTLWARRDLNCNHQMGPGSSPFAFKDILILHYDGTDHQYVVALDKRTGETVWKKDRGTDFGKAAPDKHKAFSTPILIDVHGPQIISCGAFAVRAYQPETGDEIWSVRYPGGYSNVSRPVYTNGLLIINTGYDQAQIWAIRPDGHGDVTDSHVVWKDTAKNLPLKPSIAAVNDLLFFVSDTGVATCLEAKTGTKVWQERIRGAFSASPLVSPGRIYFFDQDGKTTVIAPERKLNILAVNTLDDGFMASPAVVGKALILRTATHLYRIEK
jgi:outer membrane protein assembly factor BamB